MATPEDKKVADSKGTKKVAKVAPPAGFTVKVGREDGIGWVKKAPGNVVHGKLNGRHEFRGQDGKMRAFYQITLQSDCHVTSKNEDDETKYDEFVAKAGDVVNLDEVAKISDLADKCSDGGVYNVWMVFKEKVKRPGSTNTPWNFEGPYVEVIKPPTARRSDSPF